MSVEGGLTIIAVAAAFCWPRFGVPFFARIEHVFGQLARKRGLAILTIGLTALLLRLAILPFCPIPLPFIHDDFSFLLAADTFASGRLTNPTPAMWRHFESFHITMKPTYMSMYFPAQGLVMAAGKVFFGHPWFGILCVTALMCAAICWALQAWLPPTWAFLGGMLVVLRLGLFSYWINTYTGAGSIAALGGALVLGALPRFTKTVRLRYAMLMAVGMILLATSRPYEGLLLCLPVTMVLGRWLFTGNNRPTPQVLSRSTALPLLLVVFAGAWMGYYDHRAFGNALTPPYKINRATYAIAPYYVWQSARPEPVYRHAAMRNFYSHDELDVFKAIHSPTGFLPETLKKGIKGVFFFSGMLLLPPLIMLRRVLTDRRVRFLVICILVLCAGMTIQIFLLPHYLAPFTVVFYALGLQAMRYLRVWRPGDQPVGTGLVRLIVALCVVLGVVRLFAVPLHFNVVPWPANSWTKWYGPGNFGIARATVERKLEQMPGKQLVIVRYSPDHNPLDEWVYNAADIDHSKVIWAREMGQTEDLELIHYYKDRNVWLVQPDLQPVGVSAYLLPKPTLPSTAISSASTMHELKAKQKG